MSNEQSMALSNVHKTALSAAALRAAHVLVGSDPKVFSDVLALPLCGMSAEEVVAFVARVPAQSAATCVLRSRYTEERLAAARARLDQYVVLGAGLDSYALRMGAGLGNLNVFEVDDPVFSLWKQQRIAQIGLTSPSHLHFVPCDFETTALTDALAASEFDGDRPCFISWLGVTQYLTPEATIETLRWAGSRPKGSEVVLTFLDEDAQSPDLITSMAARGITQQTHFKPERMSAILRQAGFSQVEHLTQTATTEHYLKDRADGLQTPHTQRLVSATV